MATAKPKINKLLLIRKASIRSTLLERMGVSKFAAEKPIAVSPKTWADENGESHYAYVLTGMSVGELKELEKWISLNLGEEATLHNFPDEKNNVIDALSAVGLRINESV